MAKDIFLFHGGTYKHSINSCDGDDGRLRVPLTRKEGDLVIHDSELPGDTDNSVGGELHMNRWAELFNAAEVGDRFYIQVAPDATGYRGIFAVPQDPVPGLTVEFDLVSVADIAHRNHCGLDYADATTYGPTTELDFSVGIGDSPEEAGLNADLNCEPYENFRATCPGLMEYFATPFIAKIGQAVYLRMTIKTLPDKSPSSPCGQCTKQYGWPKLHYGLIVDKLCLSKLEWRDFCRCKAPICAGCDSNECDDCNDCPEVVAPDEL